MAALDLKTFSRVVEAIYSEALRIIGETHDAVQHKAWHRVATHLADAIVAADPSTYCPVCGEARELIACRWCGETCCGAPECAAAVHDGARECPHRPEPKRPFLGEEDDDVAF